MLMNWLGYAKQTKGAKDIYASAVNEARISEYYSAMGVPDTVDGRFDMITLIVSLVLSRVGKIPSAGKSLGQEIFDVMFADMEQNLREIGVSDEGMKYKIREMSGGFMGRMRTYGRLCENRDGYDENQLLEQWKLAVSRNIFRIDGVAAPGSIVLAQRAFEINSYLDKLNDADITNGKIGFPDF